MTQSIKSLDDRLPVEGSTPESFDLNAFFPYLVRIFYRSVITSVSRVYATRYGLSVSEWRTMAVLGTSGALSAGDIVERSSMDKVNVSRAIKALREREYLKRDIDGDDRRRAVVRLTDLGREVFRDLVPRVAEVEEGLLHGLSQGERATLFGLMEKVRSNAEALPLSGHAAKGRGQPQSACRVSSLADAVDTGQTRAAMDEIFYHTSQTQSFSDSTKRTAFHERWLGRYLEKWPHLCFYAEDGHGEVVGYLAGCPDNPATSPDFTDHRYYSLFEAECRRFPAHLHVNVRPDNRNDGVGRTLIEAFAAACASEGISGIHAVTADGNRNNRFFESCGLTAQARGEWNGTQLVFCGRVL